MGYAAPLIRKVGYTPTDDVIWEDTTVYTNNGQTYTTKISGSLIEEMAGNSTLRFKCDLKSNGAGAQYTAYMQMLFDGVAVWSEKDADAVYTTYTTDIDMNNYLRGTLMEVQIKSKSVGVDTTSLTNFQICGVISPFLIL